MRHHLRTGLRLQGSGCHAAAPGTRSESRPIALRQRCFQAAAYSAPSMRDAMPGFQAPHRNDQQGLASILAPNVGNPMNDCYFAGVVRPTDSGSDLRLRHDWGLARGQVVEVRHHNVTRGGSPGGIGRTERRPKKNCPKSVARFLWCRGCLGSAYRVGSR
jgi:hypothetical protein